MIAASLVYACMGACIKLTAELQVPVAQITFYRCLISLVLIFAILRLRGTPLRTRHWRAHLTRSFTGVASMATYYYAITLLPLATAITLNYTKPLFVALMMLAAGAWRFRAGTLIALIGGFAGVALMLRPSATPTQWLGVAMALGSAFLSAGSVLSIRRLGLLGEPTWRTVFYFTLSATILTFPWYLASSPWTAMEAHAVLLLLSVGALATIGQVMLTMAYQHGETLVSASLGYSQVIFASVLGYCIWQETPAGEAWIGIPLIVASGLITLTLQHRARQNIARRHCDTVTAHPDAPRDSADRS